MIPMLKSVIGGLLLITPIGLGGRVIHNAGGGTRTQSASDKSKACLKYLLQSSALTFTKQGESVEIHTYTVSDGAKVYANYFYYHSSQKAVREMNRRLASAIEIISRETMSNEKGQNTGVKVVGKFKSRIVGRQFQIVWTSGSNLKVVSGPSLTHVIQLLKPDCNASEPEKDGRMLEMEKRGSGDCAALTRRSSQTSVMTPRIFNPTTHTSTKTKVSDMLSPTWARCITCTPATKDNHLRCPRFGSDDSRVVGHNLSTSLG